MKRYSRRKITASTYGNRDIDYRKLAEDCGKISDMLDDLTIDMDNINQKYEDLPDFVSHEEVDAIYKMIETLRDIKMFIRNDIDEVE